MGWQFDLLLPKCYFMRKYMIVIALAIFASCAGDDQKVEQTVADEPISQTNNSPEFNTAFAGLLDNYYHLKDALVLTNDTMANNSAQLLAAAADSFPINSLKGDSSIGQMADGYFGSIAAEAKALTGEKNMDEKRKSFQMISDNMYDLVRTVRYDREKVYHQFCPMAFNDAGGYWLSKSSDIKNPYFGKKMLTCGEVKDSLDFR